MNIDDRNILEAIVEELGGSVSITLHTESPTHQALKDILAHLDQPYQWGDEVEALVGTDNVWEIHHHFIGMSKSGKYVVEGNHSDHLHYAKEIRHPKQTVPVKLPKELVERLRKKCSLALTEHPTLLECDLDAAIAASQEGEDNCKHKTIDSYGICARCGHKVDNPDDYCDGGG